MFAHVEKRKQKPGYKSHGVGIKNTFYDIDFAFVAGHAEHSHRKRQYV